MSAESRSDRTAGIVSPARWAVTSSSVKNGFPWPRARICSTRSWGAVAPSSVVTRAVMSARREAGELDPVHVPGGG